MAIDTNYQMKQGEGADAYNTRVAEYNASKHKGETPAPTDTTDPFLKTIQDKLISQSDVISSSSSNIESAINNAIAGSKKSTELGSAAIESRFGREMGYAQDQAKREFTNFSESRSGFGTQMAAFRNLVQTTDKELKDLDQRKEELIMQNDSAGASRVAELQMKSLEFKQKAAQDVFSNILQSGSFGLQVQSEQRAGREFVANLDLNKQRLQLDKDKMLQDQQTAMASLASEYGVELKVGDTLADVVSRVSPMASSLKKAELNRMLAETSKINKEFDKQGIMANFQSRVAQLIAGGATPSEATMQTLAEGKAVGLDVTPELFNFTQQASDEAKKQIDEMNKKTQAETAPTYWENVFRGFAEMEKGSPVQKGFEAWKGLVGF